MVETKGRRRFHWPVYLDEMENAPPLTPEEGKRLSEKFKKEQAEYRKSRAAEAGDEQLKSKETDTGSASK